MRKILFGLALTAILAACSTDSYKISGSFEDITEGTVYLRKIGMQNFVEVDTAEIVGGAYSFKGSVEYPELYLIFVNEARTPIAFFLENSSVSIKSNSEKPEDAVIKGSKLSDIFTKLNKEFPHIEKIEKMNEEFMRAQSQGDQATMESIMADLDTIVEEQKNYYREFVNANNNNAVGAFIALKMAQSMEMEELEGLALTMKTNMGDHPYVTQLFEIIEPLKAQMELEAALAVGQEAPLFTLKDINGNDVSLESFRGKYVFLDFWAAWCRPCREENPNLVEVYKKFGGENFEIISVSLDQTEEAWKGAVKEDKLTWTLLHDPLGNVANNYAIQSIPSTWLLDKEGEIIFKDLRGEAIGATVEALLQQ